MPLQVFCLVYTQSCPVVPYVRNSILLCRGKLFLLCDCILVQIFIIVKEKVKNSYVTESFNSAFLVDQIPLFDVMFEGLF